MRTVCFAFLAVMMMGVCLFGSAAQAQSQSAGKALRDCADCPEMIEIPGGTFGMGMPPGEDERINAPDYMRGIGVPQRRVTISPFMLGKYKVTLAEFRAFVAETGYDAGNTCYIYRRDPNQNNQWRFIKTGGHSWKNPGFEQTDRHPAVCLDWFDSKAYVAWLSKKTGKSYRLPTEAEWEYAARAGTVTAYFWGDDPNQACTYANVTDLTFAEAHEVDKKTVFQCADGYAHASPVGSFKPNAFGLYDMLGNVWEYLEDCTTVNYQGAPTDGSVFGKGPCPAHIIRGAAWNGEIARLRTGIRGLPPIDKQEPTHGLRVARDR